MMDSFKADRAADKSEKAADKAAAEVEKARRDAVVEKARSDTEVEKARGDLEKARIERENPDTIKFKVVKQDTIIEVEVGSVVYERIKTNPTEYQPLSPIPKEPDRPGIIDGDAEKAKANKKKEKA